MRFSASGANTRARHIDDAGAYSAGTRARMSVRGRAIASVAISENSVPRAGAHSLHAAACWPQ